ncbi:MAG TPA: SMP-30/gluconolactonase/LRE family protein [Candidatus Acidoferrales bacterium]|jgi:DNA-binding beta-propeller fold protein YncE|nr:SMP-30/gluconolactonase/LRE family protein [Candidatus Acidoferrales bacterium]
MRRFGIAALLAAGIAGCSGGGSPMLPASRQAPSGTVLARLTIKVPHRTRAHRRGHYVSPATASLAYAVDGVTQTPVTISPSSPNCKVNGPISYLQCSVNLSIKPGNHTFAFTTKDAAANVLSANTHVTFNVVAGSSNTIPVTLGGVASSLAVYPPAVPQVVVGSGGGFTVYGKNALQFSIVPLDADGNAILGPGAPQPVVSAAPVSMTMKTPAPIAPNLWTFTSTYAPTDPSVAKVSSISISATPVPNSGGATVSATIPLALYVPWIYATSENGGDAVVVTDEGGTAQPVSGTFPNLSSVNGIAYDPHNGFLYVENGGTSNITVYDLQGRQQTVAGSFQNGGPDQPGGIVFDPHDNLLYVTYFSSDSVSAFDEQGRLQTTSGAFANLTNPIGIAYDGADRALYVANAAGSVTAYDEQGVQKALPGGFPNLTAPAGLAYDSIDAFLFVTNTNFGGGAPGSITVYDTQGNQQTVSGSFPGLGQGPTSIAHDPHNDWFYVGDCSGAPVHAFDANGNQQTLSGTPSTYVPGIAIVP